MTERETDIPRHAERAMTVYQHLESHAEVHETLEEISAENMKHLYDLAVGASFGVRRGDDRRGPLIEHSQYTGLWFREYSEVLSPGEAVAVWESLELLRGQKRLRVIIRNRDGIPTIQPDNPVNRLRLKAQGVIVKEYPLDSKAVTGSHESDS